MHYEVHYEGIYPMRATKLATITAASLFALSMAACGDSADDAATAAPTPVATTPTTVAASSAAPMEMTQFGAGCAAVPTDAVQPGQLRRDVQGAGRHRRLRQPAAEAPWSPRSPRPSLGDSLNTAPALTVFAPTNDAFGKIPKADLDKVLADNKTLTSILTYHVVAGKLAPAELAGTHKTLQGGEIEVAGSGDGLQGQRRRASVICGNVQTANATVYIIDSVLMPKS